MNALLFIEELLDHRLLYPILVIIIGALSPFACSENIVRVERVMDRFTINVTILAIILLTSMVDMPLALLWTFTYLMLWSWIWDARNKREIRAILESKKK